MGSGARYLTIDEARAIECNQCGDCCDSRRAFATSSVDWSWGNVAGDDPMILPLFQTHGGHWEAIPGIVRRGSRIGRFECRHFEATAPDRARCAIQYSDKPEVCSVFPVFSDVATEWLEKFPWANYKLNSRVLPRCSWYGVRIVLPSFKPVTATSIYDTDGYYICPEMPPSLIDELVIRDD